MNIEIKEIDNLIETLNMEIYEVLGEDFVNDNYDVCFSLLSNGWSMGVEFLGLQIWCSENDERKYINENIPDEDLEDLEVYLRRTATELCKVLVKLDFQNGV